MIGGKNLSVGQNDEKNNNLMPSSENIPIITKKERNTLIFLGFGCLVAGIIAFAWAMSIESSNYFGYLILSHIGIAFIELVFVLLIFEIILRSEGISKIRRIFDNQIEKLVEQNNITSKQFSILQVAKESKLDNLYLRRNGLKRDFKQIFALNYFNQLAKKNNQKTVEIDMLGICLRDFFNDNGIFKEEIDPFWDSLTSFKPGNNEVQNIKIRIMILYPYSNVAIIRMIREYFKRHESESKIDPNDQNETNRTVYRKEEIKGLLENIHDQRLYKESRETVNRLRILNEKFKGNENIEFLVRICTLNPMNYILRFNNILFIEPYHFGFDTVKNEIISGKVVISAFKNGDKGDVFDLFKDHFEFLWKDKTTIDFNELIKKVKDAKYKDYTCDYLSPDDLELGNLQKIQQMVTTYECYIKAIID